MTDAQIGSPEIVLVKRWTRYGKDRAYASIGETRLGYRDLHTGELVCELAGHESTLERATDELWRAARAKRYTPRHATTPGDGSTPESPTSPTTTAPPVDAPAAVSGTVPSLPVPTDVPSATRALLPDRDLSGNRPGQAVHARAKELRDAAPIRTFVQRLGGVKSDERAWRIGGDAEEAVAKRLAALGPEWRVLHSIPVGERGSDIDHLVVGPGGVFTINAKNHPDANVWVRGDTVKVNGTNVPYVRNSRHEAARATRLLSARALFDVEVRGLIAVVGVQKGFAVVEQPRDGAVSVVKRRDVTKHLATLPTMLGAPSIARIHEVARHLATWQPTTVAWSDDFGWAGGAEGT